MLDRSTDDSRDLPVPNLTRAAAGVPILFGPASRQIFGWYHAADAPQRTCCLVLCSPVGHEGINAYRTYTKLAEKLARSGFPVLRFDYDGMGDSAGDDRDGGRVDAWLSSVRAAINEARQRSGNNQVGLIGVRIGATLALQVASEAEEVDTLVLWAPCVSGRAFAREVRAFHKLRQDAAGIVGDDGPLEVAGAVFTAETLAELSRLDALKLMRRPARRVLVIARDDVSTEKPLLRRLTELQAETTYRETPGYAAMMVPPHLSVVPEPLLDEMVTWLSGSLPDRLPAGEPGPLPVRSERPPLVTQARSGPDAPDGSDRSDRAVKEEPLFFGQGAGLFGILTEPVQPRVPPRPAVLMLNVGTNHRVGPNRMYVRLARWWAARGYPSLRFDLAGIGDSQVAEGYDDRLLYSSRSVDDVRAAMDALQQRRGINKFVLVGLCSGAYVAFQTTLVDRRVAAQVLVNPRRFTWKEGETLDSVMKQGYKSTRFYREALFRPETWRRVVRGEVDVKGIGQRLVALGSARLQRATARLVGRGPDADDVFGLFRRIGDRGVSSFVVCSPHDDGVDYVEFHLGLGGRKLRRSARFRMQFVDGSDHTFSSTGAQQHLSNVIATDLERLFG